jgi:hypothetical protein
LRLENKISNMRGFSLILFSLLVILGFSLSQCKKEPPINGTGISFTTDTLTFDTVFTSLGSTTRYFKVKNSTSKDITISNIQLMGLQGNQYRINVDGVAGKSFSNIEVLANDSLYVFVEVTVNPNAANAPFVIQDEILFSVKGQMQKVVLEAWGQNAYYHLGERYSTLNPPGVWLTDKPHIILAKRDSFPGMEVKAGVTLNIPSGARLFFGPGALLSVDGTLNALANQGDSISFDGLRLESFYQDRPGQWLGIIYGRPAKINMRGCMITESTFGVSDEHIVNVLVGDIVTTSKLSDYGSVTPEVTLDKCIIKHTAGSALTGISTKLTATNCLFHTAGGNTTGLFLGGDYEFTHCTMANVYTRYVDHKSPCLVVSDRIVDIDNTLISNPNLTAKFTNCIIYGNLQDEFGFVSAMPSTQIIFENCLLKTDVDSFAMVGNINCKINQDPEFIDPTKEIYTPDSLPSPAVNSGKPTSITNDLFYKLRDAIPDIGALEW